MPLPGKTGGMHNPLRSEADAFRWVVVIGVGAIAVIVLTLLTRPVFGVVLAAALIGFGAGVAYRSSRGSLPRSVQLTRGGDGKHRLLVVANETVGGEALLEIGLKRIEFGGARGARGGRAQQGFGEHAAHGFAVMAGAAGNLTDGDAGAEEILDHETVLHK